MTTSREQRSLIDNEVLTVYYCRLDGADFGGGHLDRDAMLKEVADLMEANPERDILCTKTKMLKSRWDRYRNEESAGPPDVREEG